jgi:ABC-type phosphate/phosphonate transport system substrate-binding protein
VEQLKGKRFVVESHGRGQVAQMWMDTLLMRAGLPGSQDFFGNVKKEMKESRAIYPVFFQQADACVVRALAFETMAELNPQIGEQLTVLSRSPGFALTLVCFARDFDAEEKKKFIEVGLTLHQYPAGKQLLTFFQQEKIVAFKPAYLENLIALQKEYETLVAQSKKGN